MNKLHTVKVGQYVGFLAALLLSTTTVAQNFYHVGDWIRDRNNNPEVDASGDGESPSISGTDAMDDQGRYNFFISSDETKAQNKTVQRQEFKFERREDSNRMVGRFRIDSEYPNFDQIAVAQTHDDQTESQGVFSIYQVRKVNGRYYFGVQGDVTEASNSYDPDIAVEIELDAWYELSLKTNSINRDDTYEIARLYSVNSSEALDYEAKQKIWENTISGGGEDLQYKKVGAYRLSSGYGPIRVSWKGLRFLADYAVEQDD